MPPACCQRWNIAGSVNVVRQQFERILTELAVNQLDSSEVRQRLGDGIVQPLTELSKRNLLTAADTIRQWSREATAEKAALIANAWARRYEAYVNSLFGGSAIAPFGDIDVQVKEARGRYDTAQETLIKYLSEENRANELQRQIAEEEAVIAKLRTGRQTAAVAIVDKQVAVKQQLINAYLESDTTNRLLAFNKGQEAKRQILSAWVDAEAANRLAAIKRDRDIRMSTFTTTVQTEIAARQQVLAQ